MNKKGQTAEIFIQCRILHLIFFQFSRACVVLHLDRKNVLEIGNAMQCHVLIVASTALKMRSFRLKKNVSEIGTQCHD